MKPKINQSKIETHLLEKKNDPDFKINFFYFYFIQLLFKY